MKDSDLWETPDELFKYLQEVYNIDIDLCATAGNAKCKQFCSSILDVPSDWLRGHTAAFMNPPYSDIAPFIRKAYELSEYCTVVMLVPSSIKTCKYMDFLDEGNGIVRQWKQGVEWLDLSRRTKFKHPTKKASSPSFGCSLLVFTPNIRK